MIQFNGFYFQASEVESVEARPCSTGDGYKAQLTVNMKSGKSYGLRYKDEAERNRVQKWLVADIDRELGKERERTDWYLGQLWDNVRRMDKRQLKIWRQLRDLLKLSEDAESETEDAESDV